MATVVKQKRKRVDAYQIHFKFRGERRFLSLGSKYGKEECDEIARYVDKLVTACETDAALDRRSLAWLDSISDDLRERLANVDLIRIKRVPTLGELWAEYWNVEYWDLKPTTQSSKRTAKRRFFEFFDESRKVDEIGKRDAQRFADELSKRMVEASKAGVIRDVRRVFNWGVDAELCEKNPFNGIKRGSFRNKAREYYVSIQDYRAMLDACPSPMWRVVLALYRIGGLRFEEALRAQWSDVDFARGRLLVHSPKTERYKGRESRVVPLFPELRSELEKLWDETPEGGSLFIIAANRTTIRKHVERIVFLAGLNRWERLIQNLRSSRAIEIAREFGELAEAEWIGHSPKVARDHYLHVLDEDFDRALQSFLGDSKNDCKNDCRDLSEKGSKAV